MNKTISEKLFAAPRKLVRVISFLNLVVAVTVSLLAGHGRWLVSAVFSLDVSMSILFMIPDEYNDSLLSVISALTASVMSMTVSAMPAFGVPENFMILLYASAVVVPLCCCLVVRTFRMMRDEDYLQARLSGWEMLLCQIKLCFTVFFMALLVLPLIFIVVFRGVWWNATALVLASAFYALLYLRSVTSSPIVRFNAAGRPEGERDVASCSYYPFKEKDDYKYMYGKLKQHMEEKRPYLDPDYSLDVLVREMFSNKSYISRIINVCTGMNFSQLVNRYRVEYSMEIFRENTDLKVREMADLSGFHSQVSFNMAFKLFNNMTPGAWCKDYRDRTSIGEKDLSSLQEQVR